MAGAAPPFDTAHTLSLLDTTEGWVGLVDGWWHDKDLLVHKCLATNGSACHAAAGVPADLWPGAAPSADRAEPDAAPGVAAHIEALRALNAKTSWSADSPGYGGVANCGFETQQFFAKFV